MARSLLFVLSIAVFILHLSCEGDDMLSPEAISGDSLLIKKIRLQWNDPDDPIDHTYVPYYDSATRTLSVFLDNTSTETLFDKIYRKYEYNESGYLTKMQVLDTNGVLSPQFWLQRNAANQIEKLVHYGIFEYEAAGADTLHFTYSGNIVQDSFQNYLGDYITQVTVFNDRKQAVSIRKEEENYMYYSYDFHYNSQGLLQTVITLGDTTEYNYDAVPVPEAWAKQCAYFLGKDTWLIQHIVPKATFGFSLLTFALDNEFNRLYDPLLTIPVLSQTTHGYYFYTTEPVSRTVRFTNTYTPDHMLATQTISGNSNRTVKFTFSY